MGIHTSTWGTTSGACGVWVFSRTMSARGWRISFESDTRMTPPGWNQSLSAVQGSSTQSVLAMPRRRAASLANARTQLSWKLTVSAGSSSIELLSTGVLPSASESSLTRPDSGSL